MNYIEGCTLKDLLQASGNKIPFDKALGIIIPVLDALIEVHAVSTKSEKNMSRDSRIEYHLKGNDPVVEYD